MIKKEHFNKPRNELEHSDFQTDMAPLRIPEEGCIACPGCKAMLFQNDLNKQAGVCPRCGHHFRLGAMGRLGLMLDEDSFEEFGADMQPQDTLQFPGYEKKLEAARAASGLDEAVVCGTGSIGGHGCMAFAMDTAFMMASMGQVVGEKITQAFERAAEMRLPVVGFIASGGARMQEGMLSLMQMAKTSGAVKKHSNAGLLYIAVLCNPTTGGVTASFAMQADIIVAEPRALIAFAGPRVIEQTIRQPLPEGFQQAEFLLEKGFLDDVVERGRLRGYLEQALALHAPAPEIKQSKMDEMTVRPDVEHLETGAGVNAGEGATSAYERLNMARSAERPTSQRYIEHMISGFMEMHGDRRFADDAAVIAGIGWLRDMPVTVIALEKGSTTNEKVRRNFGSAHPEGYRKALRQMKLAEKFGRPVMCLIDTSGAYCGIGAEERGQGQAIAENLMEMMTLGTPVISLLVGEGGSGGALALAVADEVWMMENAVYSVISPEGCASILWKDASKVKDAAESLHITANDILRLGLVERVVSEQPDMSAAMESIEQLLYEGFGRLGQLPVEQLLQRRYDRFRKVGAHA